MLERVRRYIEGEKLLQPYAKVIVGLSGGADSMALIDILTRLGYHCVAAHCNFHLRGPESDRDAGFVKGWCERQDIPLLNIDFDTYRHAQEQKLSIEMAARELRYDWFEAIRQEQGAEAIAVAHHRDDSVETVLLNLIRGTGIKGLTGIPARNGQVVRPLLAVTRTDIEAYMAKRSIPHVTDSTNQEELYVRNLIRLRILPELEKINPKVREAIYRTSRNLAEVEKLYNRSIEETRRLLWNDVENVDNDEDDKGNGNGDGSDNRNKGDVNSKGKSNDNRDRNETRININLLQESASPQAVLFELLSPLGFSPSTIRDILESLHGEPGKQFYGESYRLIKDRGVLLLHPLRERCADTETFLIEAGVGKIDFPVQLTLRVEAMPVTIRKESRFLYMDADKVTFPLTLRRWQPGDWFIPFGMRGRKKLSDFFVDKKFSLKEKEDAWLLLSGDQVAWVVGERGDHRFRVTESTKRVLVIEWSS
ncbi:MAG TPA: tRNA lysidine(34) synthetase TilS [Bacteroidales bacterium]|jgi:tRNA(Ile)-lysidine synthase|nr:tRNA lysidine(34) synthetase TilS [Bacteroidales bacterium]